MEEREFSYIDNTKKYYKARCLNLIFDNICMHADHIFEFIQDKYEMDEKIQQEDIQTFENIIKDGIAQLLDSLNHIEEIN